MRRAACRPRRRRESSARLRDLGDEVQPDHLRLGRDNAAALRLRQLVRKIPPRIAPASRMCARARACLRGDRRDPVGPSHRASSPPPSSSARSLRVAGSAHIAAARRGMSVGLHRLRAHAVVADVPVGERDPLTAYEVFGPSPPGSRNIRGVEHTSPGTGPGARRRPVETVPSSSSTYSCRASA